MTLLPQTQCCALLGIDPKTLRNWLRRAQIPFTAHPMDARLRCLTEAQVQELATLHTRPLVSQSLLPLWVRTDACTPSELVSLKAEHHDLPASTTQRESQTGEPEASLLSKLAALETQVATLQEQLTQLTQELLHERQLRSEQRLGTLEALLFQMKDSSSASQALSPNTASPVQTSEAPEPPSQAQRPTSRERVLPLIEYTADGSYMILSPDVGELTFPPDSPEWFAWLSTLHSFRFVGQYGSVGLSRSGPNRPTWRAHRTRNGRRSDRGAGHTSQLTVAALEQLAATL